MALTKYYLARLESGPDYRTANVGASLVKILQTPVEIQVYGDNKYRFLLGQEYSVGGIKFAFGQLTRYSRSEVGVVDSSNNQEGGQTIDNLIQARNRFFIHLDSGFMAHTMKDGITNDTFENVLAKLLLESCVENQLDIHGFVIKRLNKEEYDFKEELRSFSSVNRLDIRLRPSNPHSDDEWADIDERLHTLKSTSYREVYTNRNGELNVVDDDEINRKIIMAHKYGDAFASGLDRSQKQRTIRISKDQREIKVDSEMTPNEVVERLAPTLIDFSRQG